MVRIGGRESKEYGRNIKYFRTGKGTTQNELARSIKVSVMTVRRWGYEEREPRISEISRLCEFFGITETELLNGPSEETWVLKLLIGGKEEKEETLVSVSSFCLEYSVRYPVLSQEAENHANEV